MPDLTAHYQHGLQIGWFSDQGSPYGLAASPCAGAGSHIPWHFPYVFAAPHAILRPSTQAISPYGIAVPPYGHTPDASPHTPHQISRQIPIGRPFSHSHGRSPIARPSPHTIHNLLKVGLSFDETSGSSSTNPNQPRQADTRDLRYNPANQAPASSSKCYRPATGGGCRHLLRVRSCAHFHGHMHGHGHTCTGMCTAKRIHARSLTRTPSQACAYLHGHGASQFDETSVRRNKSPTNPVKQTP